MKKIISLTLILALALSFTIPAAAAEEKKINIVATIFPIYDWVREIAGENDNVQITLLLDSGVDLHSYQPTVADITKISGSDIFIYVGGESDEWAEDVLNGNTNPDMTAISLVEAMEDDIKMEEIVEGMEHEHDHDEDEEHDHGDEDHEHEDHEHGEEADEHVWLSLRNAQKLTGAIALAMAEADPANGESYRANAAAYIKKLAALDQEYTDALSGAAFHTVLFGDRFPFRYLADDYNISYYAAFSGCSAETEASFQTIVFLAGKVEELGLPAVLTIEGSNHKIAETIISSTAAGNQKLLSMNSLQGVTMNDIEAGITYLSAMKENLEVLKQALN